MFIAVDDVDTNIADGSLDLESLEAIGVDGSGSYYSIKKKESHKYSAKLNN